MAIWRRVACWISKATRAKAHVRARAPTTIPTSTHTRTHALSHACTHTDRNKKYLLLFHSDSGYVNAPQSYVIRTRILSTKHFAQTPK